MPDNNFIKNITSKDNSKNTILNMIKTANKNEFETLCDNCDFIFDFIKERIINTFVDLITKDDIKTLFEFSKIYCADFEDMIVKSWLKYANEDLTDDILEIFENGTDGQRAYCASYFKHIKDPLALDCLNKYALSDFTPLKINCAQTLRAFNQIEQYENIKNIIKNSNDDFEKLSAYEFISAYGCSDAIKFISDNLKDSPFKVDIVSYLLDFNSLENIKNTLSKEEIIEIFNTLIEGYPEDISLNTISYYRILDFCKIMLELKAYNSLIYTRIKFLEFNSNDIYSFDLDKNLKNELNSICTYLKNLNLEFHFEDNEISFDIVKELKLEKHYLDIANLVNSKKISDTLIAKAVLILKELNQTNLIDKSVINSIENENVRTLVEACVL